jgi:hypothetical protein
MSDLSDISSEEEEEEARFARHGRRKTVVVDDDDDDEPFQNGDSPPPSPPPPPPQQKKGAKDTVPRYIHMIKNPAVEYEDGYISLRFVATAGNVEISEETTRTVRIPLGYYFCARSNTKHAQKHACWRFGVRYTALIVAISTAFADVSNGKYTEAYVRRRFKDRHGVKIRHFFKCILPSDDKCNARIEYVLEIDHLLCLLADVGGTVCVVESTRAVVEKCSEFLSAWDPRHENALQAREYGIERVFELLDEYPSGDEERAELKLVRSKIKSGELDVKTESASAASKKKEKERSWQEMVRTIARLSDRIDVLEGKAPSERKKKPPHKAEKHKAEKHKAEKRKAEEHKEKRKAAEPSHKAAAAEEAPTKKRRRAEVTHFDEDDDSDLLGG